MSAVDGIALSCLLLVFVSVGWWGSRQVSSEQGYLLANRGTGLFALTATLVMTEFNTSTLVAFSSLGYLAGWWALALPFVFLVGLLFYSATVAKKWKQLNGFSVAQLFTEKYGPTMGKLASGALLTAMAGFSAVYVKSMTLIFHPLLPSLSFGVLSCLLVGAVLLMTLRGGLVAIIQTDVVSFCLLCVFLPALTYFAWQYSSVEAVQQTYQWENVSTLLPPWLVLTLTLLTMFTYILAPWYGQKIFAARSESVARWSVFLAALLVFIFYGCAVLATSFLGTDSHSLGSPDQALPYIIQNWLPAGGRGLAYGFLFAAAATTLSGVWSAMVTMTIGDFLHQTQAPSPSRGMVLTLLFAMTSTLLANTLVDQVFQKLILANIPVLALSFALLAGFYWDKATPLAAYTSTLVGLTWGIGTYLYFGEEGGYQWYWVLYGLPLIFTSGVLTALYRPNRESIIKLKLKSSNC